MREFANEAEVEQLYKETKQEIVIFEGSVYDIGEYKHTHPGGAAYFDDYMGQSIDEPFEAEGHSKAARKIFQDLPLVGYIAGSGAIDEAEKRKINSFAGQKLESKFQIDYDRGMVNQIWDMPEVDFDEYVKWVNEPKHLINPVRDIRMFHDDFSEWVSKTPWYRVLIVWIPVCLYHIWSSELSVTNTAIGMAIGLFLWTFAEYSLHRFMFHGEVYWLPRTPKWIAFHFLFHGVHHAFPMDQYRLVFPPHMSLLLWFCMVKPAAALVTPADWMCAVGAGIQIGYMCYDMIHYWTHHAEVRCTHLKNMKRYHMLHHYRNGDIGFGVSNKFWDYVFGTEIPDA